MYSSSADEVRSGMFTKNPICPICLFFTSSQVSRTPTRGRSVRSSIPRICIYQTCERNFAKLMLRLSCCARGAGISWRWPRWTHTINTGGWRQDAQWGQPSCTCSASKSSSSTVDSRCFCRSNSAFHSFKARSILGRLKLWLPKGPTIPAAELAKSVGFRNAPRGSLSDFFRIFIIIFGKESLLLNGIIEWRQWRRLRRCKLDYKKGKINQFTLDPWSWTSVA